MRILLDNCVPVRLGRSIIGHDTKSVVHLGWAALTDGALLDAMTGKFDVLVTVDRSLPLQQNMAGRPFALIVLRANSNRLGDLSPLVPVLLRELKSVNPGDVRVIGR